MNKKAFASVAVLVAVFIFLSGPAVTQAAGEAIAKLQVKTLTLSAKKSFIQRKGSKPVLIKDNLKVAGNISLRDGGTVDGIDVGQLSASVSTLQAAIDALEVGDTFPINCSSGQVAKFDGESWECADDDTGGEGGSYTAGTGISISEGVISSTVSDTNTTYTAGVGLTLDGTTFSATGASYDNVIVVAKSGGAFTTIQEAIDSIEDSAEDNQYVIWVAPGEYDEAISLQNYIHIVGAAKNAVTISYGDSIFATPLINVAVGNSISNVILDATATSLPGVAVYVSAGEDIALRNVDLSIDGSVVFNYAINNTGVVTMYDTAITASSGNLAYGVGGVGQLTMVRSSITAQNSTSSSGISIQSGSDPQLIEIQDSTIVATGGDGCYAFSQTGGSNVTVNISNSTLQGIDCSGDTRALSGQSGTVFTVRNSVLSSDGTNAITYGDSPTAVYLGATQIDGGIAGSTGTVVCAASYDGSFAALDASCE